MNTVIFKWNPAFSSYSMMGFLCELSNANRYGIFDYNWSVWDYDQIHKGDRFYWVKVGMYGQTGIVGRGTITSDPYEGDDWSGQGRKTYYVDFEPETMVNPDALPILTTAELQKEIPDFQWDGGHSGLVLTPEQAERLDSIWARYIRTNVPAFEKAASLDRGNKDLIYSKAYNEAHRAKEEEKEEEKPAVEPTESELYMQKVKDDAEHGIWAEDVRELIDGFDLINGKIGSFHDSEVVGLEADHEADCMTLRLHMCNGADHLLVLRFEGSIYYEVWAEGHIYLDFGYFYSENGRVTLELEGYGELTSRKIQVVSLTPWEGE